jgi:hypothetical protein
MSALNFALPPAVTEFDGAVFADYFKRFVIDCATLGSATARIPIAAGTTIVKVRAVVSEAITTATNFMIGDTADHDGFLATGDSAVTAGTIKDNVLTTAAFKHGKAYTSATNQLLVIFDATPADGTLELDVFYRGYAAVGRQEVAHF